MKQKKTKFSFWLSLEGKNNNKLNFNKIADILKVEVSDIGNIYPPEINSDDSIFYKEIKWLLDLIEPKLEDLENNGVCLSESQIWMLYSYWGQCNMEFDAIVLKRMGNLGLKLCVSCWEDTELEIKENFNSNIIYELKEGIYLELKTKGEVKLNEVFKITLTVENKRRNESFILTSITIDNEYLDNFYLEHIDEKIICTENWDFFDEFCFKIDKIIKPLQKESFEIYLKPQKEGAFRGTIKAYEESKNVSQDILTVVEDI